MRRRHLAAVLVGAVLVSSLTTCVGAALIRSPAEEAARTAPPAPTPILVPVEKKVLATRVVTRGTARYRSPRQVTLADSALKTGSRVVTQLPRRGARLEPGGVLLTVSGRPVFLFEGSVPSYRDLGPGLRGPDVAQLERGLAEAGFAPGPVDGRFDASTGAAVTALYARHRARPLVATDAQLAATTPIAAGMVAGLQSSAGVHVPADEVVFVPSAPVRVAGLLTSLGASPDGAVVSVTGSRVVVAAALPVEQAGLVATGARASIDEPALNIDTNGRVLDIAPRAGTDGADGFHVAVEVMVARPSPGLVGSSVRLTIPVRSTRSARLVVPVSAVSMGAGGEPRVQTAPDGTPGPYLAVSTGLSVDGFVAVTPEEGTLLEGDDVVVGLRSEPVPGG